MMYDVEFTNSAIPNFTPFLPVLTLASGDFNAQAGSSKRNKREILNFEVNNDDPSVLNIRFFSQKLLRENREGNSLQLFSRILVDSYGFGSYLKGGKLFRSANK